MKKILNPFRYFRAQIFLAFSTLILLLVLWITVYINIDLKVERLNSFISKSQNVSKDFSSNIKNLQSFLLFGYKEKTFYTSNNQSDINSYILNLKNQKQQVNEIFKESKELNIGINKEIKKLSKDIDNLYKNAIIYKRIALLRGFKDYGVEGKMRTNAHNLEENSNIDKIILLQLRRHEKDFLLRSEELYADEFERLFQKTISENKLSPKNLNTITQYRNNFKQLVSLNSYLGMSKNKGVYGKINLLNNVVESSFLQINQLSQSRINHLLLILFYLQLGQTILISLLALFLSVYISNYFTKDIKFLTLDISNFIKSNFKDTNAIKLKKSSIKEIDFLLNAYVLFKEKIIENIVSLEQTTEQANNNASFKTQFLANMSHEIRSPLNGVIGMLNMIKTKPLSPEQMEYAEIAEHSADHLMGIVNMILDHSKMEAGKMTIEEYPINLEKELSKLIRLFEYRIRDKNIVLHFNFDTNITSSILGDNLRLQQIIINLIDNAVKFTSDGDVKLEVSLSYVKDNLQFLNFKIMDSGIGIDVTKTEQLLLAFEQADLTTTRKYGGTGLGLTISNQLVQLMGGSKLNIIALENGGSSFSFEIPFKINPNEQLEESNQNAYNVNQEMLVNKVLIVEDNKINQKVLFKLLEKIDIKSDIANNGKEAVALYSENDYDIIFMDLHMPEMDGFEATAAIHKMQKYIDNKIPIIAVTASAFDEDKVKAIANGMDDFITKPIVLKNLEETIIKQIQLIKE